MLVLQILAAAAVLAASASAFQPGADYDVDKTANLYNCTGLVPASNVTARNAADTLPQTTPSGWEQWSLFMHGTVPLVLRWSHGDPSGSAPSPAHFDVLAQINGTPMQHTVVGNLSYTDGERIKQIAVGDAVLKWDAEALWYNVSVSIDGYRLELDSFSSTRDAFHPNVAMHNGVLDQSGAWFGSVPLVRGHATGSLSFPTCDTLTMDGLTVLRHMFSENPLPKYIDRYSGGTVWGYGAAVQDTHVFYQIEKTNGTVHEAAYLGRAIPVPSVKGAYSSVWSTYAVTDDASYKLAIDDYSFNASFPGCGRDAVPFQFNASGFTLLGESTDLGGGTTMYWTLYGTTSAAAPNGTVMRSALAGFFEEYEAPCP